MIRITIAILLIMFVVQTGCSCAIDLPEAKVTVKVVDEDAKPLENVEVLIGFMAKHGIEGRIKETAEKGITSSDGVFSASKRTTDHIAYSAEKLGYYKSRGDHHFSTSTNGRWQPWNQEFTVVLRKIENPVPMYARNTHMNLITLPVSNKAIGFDLIEYDWVSPYGKGKHADLIFKLSGTYVNEREFDNKLEVTFSNKFDGIQLIKENRRQGSMLKLPKVAPEIEYKTKLVKLMSREPGKPLKRDVEDDNNYIFRIRAEEKDGKLIRAMYGKIHGDFEYDIDSENKAKIVFKYYLNPDYTRNLEFDPNNNLFRNLKSTEQVGLN